MRSVFFIGRASLAVLMLVGCGDDSRGLDAGLGGDGAVSMDSGSSADGAVSDGAVSDGAMSDGAMSDGAVSDGAVSRDAGTADSGLDERGCPRGLFEGTIEGDFSATAACSPYRFGAVQISGDLRVEAGVVIHFEDVTRLGALRAGPGAQFLCVFNEHTTRDFLEVGDVEALGTAASPLVFSRDPIDGYAAACGVVFGSGVVAHADFHSINTKFMETRVADSAFDNAGVVEGAGWVRAGALGATFDYCRFDDVELRGADFEVRNTDFLIPGVGGGPIAIVVVPSLGVVSGPTLSCRGARDTSAGIVVENNTFVMDTGSARMITVARVYGPITLGANHYVPGPPRRTNTYDGVSTGCDDEMGFYGGPISFTAPLVSPPPVGPRR